MFWNSWEALQRWQTVHYSLPTLTHSDLPTLSFSSPVTPDIIHLLYFSGHFEKWKKI